MFKKNLKKSILMSVVFFASMNVNAANVHVSGKIKRTLADGTHYGKCMIQMDSAISNGCPASGWVSLDCKATYSAPGDGDRKFNTAIAAAMSEKSVFLVIDNEKKLSGYCVAKRIDVIF